MSLYKDLSDDPLILRMARGIELVEGAVDQGTELHEGDFALVTEPAVDEPSSSTRTSVASPPTIEARP